MVILNFVVGVSFSPEPTTNGSFAKCWIREGEHFPGDIKMLKRGASGFANFGLEPYSEYYASQLVSRFTNNYLLPTDVNLYVIKRSLATLKLLLKNTERNLFTYRSLTIQDFIRIN